MRLTTDHPPTEDESNAGRLLPALEAICATQTDLARDGQRHAMRIRFALDRVAELRARTDAVGGVFEPARLEVARSILHTHVRRASAFVGSMVAPTRTDAASRSRMPLAAPAEVASDDAVDRMAA